MLAVTLSSETEEKKNVPPAKQWQFNVDVYQSDHEDEKRRINVHKIYKPTRRRDAFIKAATSPGGGLGEVRIRRRNLTHSRRGEWRKWSKLCVLRNKSVKVTIIDELTT